MVLPKKSSRSDRDLAEVVVSFRVTRDEFALLQELLDAHREDARSVGARMTVGTFFRALLRREVEHLRKPAKKAAAKKPARKKTRA